MMEAVEYNYNFEIESILTQFVALLNKCVVYRYDKNKETGERQKKQEIRPQFTFGTKSRVIYFLTNKAKNIVFPTVVIVMKSIKFDQDRVSAKWTNISRVIGDYDVEIYDRPTPITITCEVNILSTKQTDIFQIYGKLATQFQPEQFYSWCVPTVTENGYSYEELRNKVQWDGSFGIESRERVEETQEEIFKGTMNFDIQGWMFNNPKRPHATILDIGTTIPMDIDTYYRTTDQYGEYLPFVIGNEKPFSNPREWGNGHPRITLCYINQTSSSTSLTYNFRIGPDNMNVYNLRNKSYTLSLHGYNLDTVDVYLVPKNAQEDGLELQEIPFSQHSKMFPKYNTTQEKEKVVMGIKLKVVRQSRNIVVFTMGNIDYSGEFDIVVASPIDYDSINMSKGFNLKSV